MASNKSTPPQPSIEVPTQSCSIQQFDANVSNSTPSRDAHLHDDSSSPSALIRKSPTDPVTNEGNLSSRTVVPADRDFSNPSFNYIRLGYLSIFSGLAAFQPYASVLYEQKGFTPSENGLLLAFSPLSLLLVTTPVVYYAETKGLQMKIMYFSGFVSMFLLAGIVLVDNKLAVTIFSVLFYIIFAPLIPLYDEHTMTVLGDENRKYYGGFRVMAGWAWLVVSLATSVVIGAGGWHWIALPVVIGSLLHLLAIYKTPVVKEKGDHNYWEVWKHVFNNRQTLNFVIAISFMGFGYCIVFNFLNLFLVSDELNAPPILLGLCAAVTVVFELPIMHSSAWLHQRFTDEQLFMAAIFCYVFRVWGYSLLTNCWYVLFLEPFRGMTFAFMWLSAISYFKKNFPKQLANSAVGIVHASLFGLGPVFGNIVGGLIYEHYGPRKMFRVAGGILLGVSINFWIRYKCFSAFDEAKQNHLDHEKKESDGKNAGGESKETEMEGVGKVLVAAVAVPEEQNKERLTPK